MQRALAESESFLRTVFETSRSGIVLADVSGTVLQCNPTYASWMNSTPNLLIGQKLQDFLPPEIAGSVQGENKKVTDSGKRFVSRMVRRYRDNVRREVIAHKHPVGIGGAKDLAILTTITDVSQIVDGQKAQEHALSVARRSSEAKSHFIASIGHEFRTPMNAIMGFADLLRLEMTQGADPAACIDHLEPILEGCQNMIKLFDDLVGAAVLEEPNTEQEPVNIDTGELFTACCDRIVEAHPERENDFEVLIDAPCRTIRGSQDDLSEILHQLVSNAVDFSEPGSPVRLHADFDLGHVNLSVEDNGTGMTEELLDLIPAPFMSIGVDPHHANSRPGLGLFLVDTLLTRIGGGLEFESKPGEGTKVTVLLPEAVLS